MKPVEKLNLRASRTIGLALVLSASILLPTAGAGEVKVNSGIKVRDGEHRSGSMSTVNGSISIGRDCTVDGNGHSVNGSISVDDGSRVKDLESVNGSIRIGANVEVDGDLGTVNGPIRIDPDSTVDGTVRTVNGPIELQAAMVKQNLRTVNGNIEIAEGSTVRGNVVIDENKGNNRHRKPLRIEISGGSVVEGDVINENSNLEVQVILTDGGKVLGKVKNAKVQ